MGLLPKSYRLNLAKQEKEAQIHLIKVISKEFQDVALRLSGGNIVKAAEICAFMAVLTKEGRIIIKNGKLSEYNAAKIDKYVYNAVKSAHIFHKVIYPIAIKICDDDEMKAAELVGFVSYIFLMQKITLVQKTGDEKNG